MSSEPGSKADTYDRAVEGESPPPVTKKLWRERKEANLEAKKRPAASAAVGSADKGAVKAKPATKDPAKPASKPHNIPGDEVVDTKSLSMGGGKQQSYIQHSPDGPRKRLVISVSLNQASLTSKTHRELIEELMIFCKKTKKGKLTRDDVKAERNRLLEEFHT